MPKNSITDTPTLEERVDQLERGLGHIDNDLQSLTVMLTEMHAQIRDVQQFSLKIGQAQNKLHEYISHWPFVRVVKNGKDIS
jgi:uncharacterized coiled-coil protein SlyX